jgi:hypothetical protein
MRKILSFVVLATISVVLFSCSNKEEAEEKSPIIEQIICDAEKITAESSFFIPNKKFISEQFMFGKFISTEKAKSGKSCIKLAGNAEYGMTYEIKNVKENDLFQVEVWRFSSDQNGVLVASAETSDIYYQQQTKGIEKDSLGWEKLVLDVLVPKSNDGKAMKIYVWNSDKTKSAYFDDLKISYLGVQPNVKKVEAKK